MGKIAAHSNHAPHLDYAPGKTRQQPFHLNFSELYSYTQEVCMSWVNGAYMSTSPDVSEKGCEASALAKQLILLFF